jgi:2-polyprenyl-6-methoxyphenol hydroxylase-like FAD-dependent oxidoreductase
MTVLIAGGGIAGLALGLTCAEIGVPFQIYEATRAFRPLGVGINLQPNAVRELFDLGLEQTLREIGVETQEYGFYSKTGLEIWNEPRGLGAGYAWPQFSVHRGELQMTLYQALEARAPGCIKPGWRAMGFENQTDSATLHLQNADGQTRSETGGIVVAADGIHSALRAQMNPSEGQPIWNGTVLWRATTRAKPFRTGASMALIGHGMQRIVTYPISTPDQDGFCLMNWIAELTFDPSKGWGGSDWNRPVDPAKFMPEFDGWNYDWLDFHSMVASAGEVLEYPMVDRDPLDQWTHGAVTLIGDAAHATYPVGSNGASQAIVDSRKLGAAFLCHGLTREALLSYEAELRPQTTGLVLANRGGNGPDAVLQQVEDLCSGVFNDIEDVISKADLAAHAAKYKKIAGFSIKDLNAQPRTIPEGARVN